MKPSAWRHEGTIRSPAIKSHKPAFSEWSSIAQPLTCRIRKTSTNLADRKYSAPAIIHYCHSLPLSLGAAGITFGLPILLLSFYFGCNDISGCPAPALLSPSPLTWNKLVAETGWQGWWDLFSWEAMGVVLGYYLLNLTLGSILPAREVNGTKLVHHDRPLKYRLNGRGPILSCQLSLY